MGMAFPVYCRAHVLIVGRPTLREAPSTKSITPRCLCSLPRTSKPAQDPSTNLLHRPFCPRLPGSFHRFLPGHLSQSSRLRKTQRAHVALPGFAPQLPLHAIHSIRHSPPSAPPTDRPSRLVTIEPQKTMTDSMGDDSDEGGYDAQFRAEDGCDDDVREYFETLTPDVLGDGWFDRRLGTLHDGIELAAGRAFFAHPRSRDTQPPSVPARHPLRAQAWVLSQAPVGSTVRIYCYMLTDPYAIDLIIHHGADKTVQVILHPDEKNRSRLEHFFNEHGHIALRAFRDRLQVRVANTRLIRENNYSSMHDESIITSDHCTFGSYNLSCPARYQSWESLYIADVEPSHVLRFDQLWNSLARRTIQDVYETWAPSPAGGDGSGTGGARRGRSQRGSGGHDGGAQIRGPKRNRTGA